MRTLWLSFLAVSLIFAFLFSCGDDDDDDAGASPQDDDVVDDDSTADDDDDNDDDASDDDDDDDDDSTLPEWIEIDAGNMTMRIRTADYYMEILGPEGQTLLATTEPGKALNLSPMPFLPHAFKIGNYGNDWFYAREATAYQENQGVHEMTIRAVDVETGTRIGTVALSVEVIDDSHLVFTNTAADVEEIRYNTNSFALDSDEHFFGMGWMTDGIDSRGKLRNMFLGLGVNATDQIQNHAPIPFYISSRGYGLFVEEKGHGYFDLGRETDVAYGYKYRGDSLRTHIFWGPEPLELLETYASVTGYPPMNPDFAFGYLHWRNNNNSGQEVYEDADDLRSYGIPCSSIMVDAPWATAYNTFEFNECPSGCQFIDAQDMIDYVHEKGFAFYLWTSEFVNRITTPEVPGQIGDNSAQFDFARNQGYLISILGFLYQYPWWHDSGAMVNFLNPDAYDWYQDTARNVMDMGVQGFKMDGGEYIGADCIGLWTLGAFDLGGFGDSNTAQYDYRWNYHQLFWELAQEYNGDNGFTTVRTAVWGEQSHFNYFWPGDLETDWERTLGLKADVTGGLNMGAAGFPYYGSNNFGYGSGNPSSDPELYIRWTQYSAFRPIFESSKDGTQKVWQQIPEHLDTFRRYVTIHQRLFPYMKTYAYEATQTGRPIMRMLPLHYLDDPNTYDRDFDYLLGDWLLVAPVVDAGATSRQVYLPAEDVWVNWFTGEAHGSGLINEAVELEDIPVYAKGGAIIPLLDPSVETLWATDDPGIIDYEDAADLLWVDLFPYGASSFTMTDQTSFALNQSKGGFELTISGAPLERTYSLRAVVNTYDGAAPTSVTGPTGALSEWGSYGEWEAAETGWYYNPTTSELWIRDFCAGGAFSVN